MPDTSPGMITGQLAEYAAALSFADIPADVVEHVKRMTANMIAATLYGAHTAGGRQVEDVLVRLGGRPEATVFGTATRLPSAYAAAIHASRAFATMTDDTHASAQIHSGHATVLPALGIGEVLDLAGPDYITAVVAANEVAIRIAHSVGPEQSATFNTFRGGFWGELKCTFAAAIAAGRAAQLDAGRLAAALGIAATSSSGLLSTGYGLPPQSTVCGSVMAWDAGKAVLLGMLAVDLAQAGMTVAPEALEGTQGWVRTYTGGHGSIESLTDGLGTRFDTRAIALKPHCMSHTSFALVEAATSLVVDHNIDPSDIAAVTLLGPSYLPDFLWRTEVTCFEDAVCSTPFAVAMGVLEPATMTLPDRVWGRVGDDRMTALLRRFEFEVDDSIPVSAGPLAGAVRITLLDGRVYEARADTTCSGMYPDRPLTEGDLERKLRGSAEGLLGGTAADDLLAAIDGLEHVSIPDLVRSLAGDAGASRPVVWS
jgi:2-methylcitrate dehydratase PrpD